MEQPIRNIADTALWVAVYRADESGRPDAVFHDPYARKLAGERGEQIVQAMEAGRENSWSFVARTYLFDKIILQQVKSGIRQVVNLASGLDVRPYRLALPPSCTWVDVDLPQITDYMSEQMQHNQPVCEHERVSLDLSERQERLRLFNDLASRNKKTLVVAEGLVGYLPEEEVGALAYDLSHTANFDELVVDLMSPGILPLIQKEMGSLLDNARSPLVFAPEEGEDFFHLFGWTIIDSYSKMKTAASLDRLPKHLKEFAAHSEPVGPKRNFPWSGVCLYQKSRPSHF